MMSSGQSASDSQNGQTAIGILVRTKKSASGLSGGAMKPRMTTAFLCSRLVFSENSMPSAQTSLKLSLAGLAAPSTECLTPPAT